MSTPPRTFTFVLIVLALVLVSGFFVWVFVASQPAPQSSAVTRAALEAALRKPLAGASSTNADSAALQSALAQPAARGTASSGSAAASRTDLHAALTK